MVNILIIEDDVHLNESVCCYLNHCGYSAEGAQNGRDALKLMEGKKYDLLISDIMMPRMDGFTFADTVRAIDQSIPILFMTARDDLASKEKGYAAGIDDYLVKPFELAELKLRIAALLRRAKIEQSKKIEIGDFSVRLKPLYRYGRYDHYDYIMEDINKMAEELSRNEMLKADFISNVSHEIKTPLTVINNYATMLQAERIVQEERMAYAQAVLTAAQSLNGLVSNILKLNKLENQIIQEQKTQLRLGDYIGELVLGFENSLDEKNIEITCDLDDVVCLADKTLIAVICNNLLSNAVKFTPVGGENSGLFERKRRTYSAQSCRYGHRNDAGDRRAHFR